MPGVVVPTPTLPESKTVNKVVEDLLATMKVRPPPASFPQTVNLAYVVEVPKATSSELVVKLTVVPESVQPEVPLPDPVTQVPAMEKHPEVKSMPLASEDDAPEVEKIDPPVMVKPLEVLIPPDDNPPWKVEVAEDDDVICWETTR